MQRKREILVTGAAGMLGQSIKRVLDKDQHTDFILLTECDITSTAEINRVFEKHHPTVVINCAAYTAVDLAEEEVEKAYRTNRFGVKNLASACENYRARFIHISTDYVFDGRSSLPYLPTDAPNPINAYGASKLAGEQEVILSGCEYYIFRTSWLYAPFGRNFYTFIRDLRKNEVSILTSQTGSPTSAMDLAGFLIEVATRPQDRSGIYHYCNSGETTWYNFAKTIAEKMNPNLSVIPTLSFPTKALRPNFSVLNCAATKKDFDWTIPSWKEALSQVMQTDL